MFPVRYEHLHIKSKSIPVTGSGGLSGCEMLRIPHCLDNSSTKSKHFECDGLPYRNAIMSVSAREAGIVVSTATG
jgi:hypothetical protein